MVLDPTYKYLLLYQGKAVGYIKGNNFFDNNGKPEGVIEGSTFIYGSGSTPLQRGTICSTSRLVREDGLELELVIESAEGFDALS